MIGEEGGNPARNARAATVATTPTLSRWMRLARAIDAWMKWFSSSCSSMPCSSSDSASTSGLPVGSSRSGGPILGLPELRGGRDAAADAQVLAVLRDPVLYTRPVPEQGLVRDCDHRAAVIGELGHEQPVLDECVDQLPALAFARSAQGARLRPIAAWPS